MVNPAIARLTMAALFSVLSVVESISVPSIAQTRHDLRSGIDVDETAESSAPAARPETKKSAAAIAGRMARALAAFVKRPQAVVQIGAAKTHTVRERASQSRRSCSRTSGQPGMSVADIMCT